MNKKGKWLVVSASIVLVALIGLVFAITFSQKEEAKQNNVKDKIEEKASEKEEKGIETRAKNAVDDLFADESKKLLNDTYDQEKADQVSHMVKQVKNKRVKKALNREIQKAANLYTQVKDAEKAVQALFKDEKKKELANDVDHSKIDLVKKQVETKTPQKSAQTRLLKDIELAKKLLNASALQEEEKQQSPSGKNETARNEGQNKGKPDQANKNSGNASISGKNNAAASGGNSSASQGGQSSNAGNQRAASNQPIVAKMNLASRASQIVTVVASGSSAQVKFWQKSGNTWQQVFSTSGQVGSQGVGAADEYHSRTPRGAYSLGFAFGTSNPGTSLPFRQITNRSYWISNVNDPQYNTWQERNSSSKADEHLASYPVQYRYGVVINYNTSRAKGAGSGFFLHCSNGAATAGCVAIPTSYMSSLLQKLHSGAYIVNVTSENELLNY